MKRFYSDCVGWPRADVRDGLIVMVDGGRQITRGTFLRHVDRGGAGITCWLVWFGILDTKGLTC